MSVRIGSIGRITAGETSEPVSAKTHSTGTVKVPQLVMAKKEPPTPTHMPPHIPQHSLHALSPVQLETLNATSHCPHISVLARGHCWQSWDCFDTLDYYLLLPLALLRVAERRLPRVPPTPQININCQEDHQFWSWDRFILETLRFSVLFPPQLTF